MPPEARTPAKDDALRRGRDAYARSAWAEVYAALHGLVDDPALALEDLEHLGIAAELLGRAVESQEIMARAHRTAMTEGDPCRAAYLAFWLGYSLFGKGEPARGGGWLARAATIVGESGVDCVAAGYLLMPEAVQMVESGDPAGGLERFRTLSEIAARFHDADLATLGLLGRGSALVELGRLDEGLRLIDESMVAVSEGEVTPIVVGIVYCATIDQCRRIFDVARAQEWTAALTRWCDANPDIVPFRGQCLLYRADLLRLRGDWDSAGSETEKAHIRLAEPPPAAALGTAFYQEGELQRLRGHLAEAERAYANADTLGHHPEPGRALALLARGRLQDAQGDIERAVASAPDPLSAAPLLEPAVEVAVAAGSVGMARPHAERLRAIADEFRVPMLEALAIRADARVRLATDDPSGAATGLRRALVAWRLLDAPYEVARTRVLLAEALAALGDATAAANEVAAARSTFTSLGAAPDLDALDRRGEATDARRAPAGLTPRELEVLRLLAAGRSNKAIAEALVLSEKTVARHVSNIFDKLDVSSRAAATAYAYEHGLQAPPT